MTQKKDKIPEDPKFAGWREEYECEKCRAWTGQPPVPVRQGTELAKSLGLRDFRLTHACHFRTGPDGRKHHIPTTVLETADGQVVHWIPEIP